MFLFEVQNDSHGIISAKGAPIGAFEAVSELDLWKWNDTWFPSSGFAITFASSGHVTNPDVTFPAYAFVTPKVTPSSQWGGQIFTVKKNGTLVAWTEVHVDGDVVKMMWWANGTSLANGLIKISPGDVLAFAAGSLPGSLQYPLAQPQISQ
ncbi:MAG: hypothetical protein R3F61_20545 [Myxococcota bacterium]